MLQNKIESTIFIIIIIIVTIIVINIIIIINALKTGCIKEPHMYPAINEKIDGSYLIFGYK